MLDYVSYDVDQKDAKNGEDTSVTCPKCFKSQHLDEILNKQVNS